MRLLFAFAVVLFPLAAVAQTCHEVTVCHTETVCSAPACTVVTDGVSVATVNATSLPFTGNSTADIVTVSVTKANGQYAGWTASGFTVPRSDGTGSVTFHLGSGSGNYNVTLIGSAFGRVPCATFAFR